jgi:hypothetical protein
MSLLLHFGGRYILVFLEKDYGLINLRDFGTFDFLLTKKARHKLEGDEIITKTVEQSNAMHGRQRYSSKQTALFEYPTKLRSNFTAAKILVPIYNDNTP